MNKTEMTREEILDFVLQRTREAYAMYTRTVGIAGEEHIESLMLEERWLALKDLCVKFGI